MAVHGTGRKGLTLTGGELSDGCGHGQANERDGGNEERAKRELHICCVVLYLFCSVLFLRGWTMETIRRMDGWMDELFFQRRRKEPKKYVM